LEGLRAAIALIPLEGERLRAYRAVEVLELIGTAEAKQLLRRLSAGAPGSVITLTAQQALRRLGN
jgi:hypothetical protein